MAVTSRSGIGSPLDISTVPAARIAAASGSTSSPSTIAMRTFTPSSSASACTAAAQPFGFTPPALLTMRMPCSTACFSTERSATVTKSVA